MNIDRHKKAFYDEEIVLNMVNKYRINNTSPKKLVMFYYKNRTTKYKKNIKKVTPLT